MEIELTHKFKRQCHQLYDLLNGCQKMSTLVSRLKKQSLMSPERYDPEKYKGDGLELFAEALIKLSPCDNRIGIGSYQVITGQDVGVDGSGIGNNGNPAAVQVKYRSNSERELTANGDELSNFCMAALWHANCERDDHNNLLVITTAKGLHHFTDHEMYKGKVRCLGMKELRQMVDNNQLFWNSFRQLCGVG